MTGHLKTEQKTHRGRKKKGHPWFPDPDPWIRMAWGGAPFSLGGPEPEGFPEMCVWSTWHPWGMSRLKWLVPHVPELFPYSFFRISLCALMLKHFTISMGMSKNAKREKTNALQVFQQNRGSKDKAGRCWQPLPHSFGMVFILSVLSVHASPDVERSSSVSMMRSGGGGEVIPLDCTEDGSISKSLFCPFC